MRMMTFVTTFEASCKFLGDESNRPLGRAQSRVFEEGGKIFRE